MGHVMSVYQQLLYIFVIFVVTAKIHTCVYSADRIVEQLKGVHFGSVCIGYVLYICAIYI